MTTPELLKKALCAEFDVEQMEENLWVISSPFLFSDGDEVPVFAERTSGAWALVDHGQIVSHLYFDDFNGTPGQLDRIRRLAERAACDIDDHFAIRMPLDTVPDAFDVADFIRLSAQIQGIALEQNPDAKYHRYDSQVVTTLESTLKAPYERNWSPPEIEQQVRSRWRSDLKVGNAEGKDVNVFAASTSEKVFLSAMTLDMFRKVGYANFIPLMIVHPDLNESEALARFDDYGEGTALTRSAYPEDIRTIVGTMKEVGVLVS